MKTGEGSKGKSLQGLVSHVQELGLYPKNIGDHFKSFKKSRKWIGAGSKT